MAQTKRKRRTKHRGNAAGMVEVRGRTGRPITDAERRASQGRKPARATGMAKYDKPPTWRSAANRGAIAALIFGLVTILVLKQPVSAGIALAGFMLAIYIPMTFLTDTFLYKRRLKQKAAGRA
ncbi:hypothetical protein [Conexibacter sp. SYSU D00693]|uniref:hypothetical protein n=1 Tax=Conexibacter sp. SYSU D00693 TaxID=2812560 RepID=UPI00196B932F|nr:hypothetical protein [Conexibacter sp. SYSU D00693]